MDISSSSSSSILFIFYDSPLDWRVYVSPVSIHRCILFSHMLNLNSLLLIMASKHKGTKYLRVDGASKRYQYSITI